MPVWDINQTHLLVKQAYDLERAHKVRESAFSIRLKQEFVAYHNSELNRLKRSFDKRYPVTGKLFELHTQEGKRVIRPQFDRFILKASAHATAALQCLHSIPDMLAQVAYISLEPELKCKIGNEYRVNLSTVIKHLRSEQRFDEVTNELVNLNNGDEWEHLDAIANNCKHRSIVPTSLNHDLTGTRINLRELQTVAFSRGKKSYPSRSIHSLILTEYQRLLKISVRFGCKLNILLNIMTTENSCTSTKRSL
jgi:hypothetical protein